MKIVHADNGYFEVVRLPCNCEVRVMTEDIQWGITKARREWNRERRTANHACDKEVVS